MEKKKDEDKKPFISRAVKEDLVALFTGGIFLTIMGYLFIWLTK